MCWFPVDCQQLKRTGARSAGRSAACNDFILTACVCKMKTWGDLESESGRGRREVATGRVAMIREEYGSVLSMTSMPERLNPSSSTALALGPACAPGENSKPGRKMWPKVNGGLTTGACWAPRRFTGISRSTSLHDGPFAGGLHGTGRGARTWRLNTGPPMGGRKWTGAMRQEHAEPHGQFTRIDDFIACSYLNRGPTWTPSRPPAPQSHTSFGVAVQNVRRSLRIDHQAILSQPQLAMSISL
jgi:hypothetical protein